MVDVARLGVVLGRNPLVRARLFTPGELAYCEAKAAPARHLAGTLAAKEAVIKALALGPLPAWARRIEITRSQDGAPSAAVEGMKVGLEISISHDGGMAVAVALARW